MIHTRIYIYIYTYGAFEPLQACRELCSVARASKKTAERSAVWYRDVYRLVRTRYAIHALAKRLLRYIAENSTGRLLMRSL